ncbi:HDIG domain-containing protein [Fervidobacterium changbaicum]|uniref:HDOD domain-containing protein n=2 Tax=Fervidobacterium TaxID=2422 RepID=A0AAI8GCL7_FERIS|nr:MULTISPECIES: HDOD domain-containing protein [Fervidobacterium]AMW32064.1 HDOD domain-containing protein [Fervidobacterium islandicum]QAV33853.1 HDOD domain-containing protein [Fervidobacterium changbaicum]SDH45592.1 HDIG domain-containing protein [Fervidobacterium changbaicum]
MIKELLSTISEIPTPDIVVQQIISTASNPNASAKDLEKVIAMDVGLSTKILRLVNSAYYGLPRKITKLSEAIVIVGFKTVRNLALSVFTYSALHSKHTFIDHDKLWSHFMTTAIFSEHIAKRIGFMNREEVFLAGMMHDVGKIALDLVFPVYTYELSKLSQEKQTPFFLIEYKCRVEDHMELGGELLKLWKFPDEYVSVAQYHEKPSLNPDSPYIEMICIVHLANVFSNIFMPGYSLSYGSPYLDPLTFNVLGMKPGDLKVMFHELERVFERSRDMIYGGVQDEAGIQA